MKVLLVHNFYRSSSPSGEDIVFENEKELLTKNNIKVITYTKQNDNIKNYNLVNKLLLPFNVIWSNVTYKDFKKILKNEKPDIVHFHNIWYLISPSAYYACKDLDIKVVQTVHNFRLFCTNGLLMRNNELCEYCSQIKNSKSIILKNAVKYGCYRNSKIKSLSIALSQFLHWKLDTWTNYIDAYITLTNFTKKKLMEIGIPENKIFVKPNFYPYLHYYEYQEDNYITFIGRISYEKGLQVLLDAFLKTIDLNISLKIIGDGPYSQIIRNKLNNLNIDFVGKVNHNEVVNYLKKSLAIIVPSLWYEAFPLVVVESYAFGKPVIASNIGSLSEIVKDKKTGLLFKTGDSIELAKKIRWLIKNKEKRIEMGKNAYNEFLEKYTPNKNLKLLMEIYNKVLKK